MISTVATRSQVQKKVSGKERAESTLLQFQSPSAEARELYDSEESNIFSQSSTIQYPEASPLSKSDELENSTFYGDDKPIKYIGQQKRDFIFKKHLFFHILNNPIMIHFVWQQNIRN